MLKRALWTVRLSVMNEGFLIFDFGITLCATLFSQSNHRHLDLISLITPRILVFCPQQNEQLARCDQETSRKIMLEKRFRPLSFGLSPFPKELH
jgi:hypothetical protein